MPTTIVGTTVKLASTCALALALGACSRALTVAVNPYEIALPPGGTQVFRGWVSAESPLTSTALSWAADRGLIAGTGETVTYTAPTTMGPDAVTATSRSDASQSATATVTVTTTGARVWARQFGSGEYMHDEAHGIAADAASNVLVVGSTVGNLAGTNVGGRDAFVRMYDPDGREVWTRQFGTSEDDVAVAVALDPSGNVLVVGATHGDLAGESAGDSDAFVRKYDALGTELWTRQFGSGHGDRASGVAVDAAGNVVVAGSTMGSLAGTNLGGADAYVRTYDAAGTEGWVRQFGTDANDSASGVAVDPSGRVLIVGTTRWGGWGQPWIETSGFVRCFDAAGSELWDRPIDVDQVFDGLAIAVDGFGDTLITRTVGSNGPSNTVVVKFDASGGERWSRRVGTTTTDHATAVAVDAAANVFVGGITEYRLDALWGGIRTDAFVWRFSP